MLKNLAVYVLALGMIGFVKKITSGRGSGEPVGLPPRKSPE